MIRYVAIQDCVHFRGFRYGGYGNNLYEDYILGLRDGLDIRSLRERFIERVLALQGNDWSDVLNLSLSKRYPAWDFPWSFVRHGTRSVFSALTNPDPVCHFVPEGVLASKLNHEFFWLTRAWRIMANGYRPEHFSYVRVLALRRGGAYRYIVLDGNHRVAALHAHGATGLSVQCARVGVRDKSYARFWPGVLTGNFRYDDVLRIFDRYFLETNPPLSQAPASTVIDDEPLNLWDEPQVPDFEEQGP